MAHLRTYAIKHMWAALNHTAYLHPKPDGLLNTQAEIYLMLVGPAFSSSSVNDCCFHFQF